MTTTNPFKYYDASNTQTGILANVARVDVNLAVAPKATTGNDGSTTYAVSIDLRTPTCN